MSQGQHAVVNYVTKQMKTARQHEVIRQRKINRGRIRQRAALWAIAKMAIPVEKPGTGKDVPGPKPK